MFLRGTAAGIPKGWERAGSAPIRLKTAGTRLGFVHWRELWFLLGSGRLGLQVWWGRQTRDGRSTGVILEAAVRDAGLHVDGREKKKTFRRRVS